MRLEALPEGSKFKYTPPKFPLILQLKEKHGDRFFIVNSPQEAYDVSLKILSERLSEGHWYYEPEVCASFEEYFLGYTGLTLDEAKVFDKLKLKFDGYHSTYPKDIVEALRKYYKHEEAEKAEFERIKKAVADNNGKDAYNILLSRNSYEYERFEVVQPEV